MWPPKISVGASDCVSCPISNFDHVPDYRMPTALDVPPIECVIIETPVPGVPYGVRGVGEVPIVPPAAAIANAIARATGVRILQMPMTPERVLRALRG